MQEVSSSRGRSCDTTGFNLRLFFSREPKHVLGIFDASHASDVLLVSFDVLKVFK